MTCLAPILYVPTREEKIAALNAAYDAGTTWAGFTRAEAIQELNDWEEHGLMEYLWRDPDSNGVMFCDRSDVDSIMANKRGTHVNSMQHLIAYLAKHGLTGDMTNYDLLANNQDAVDDAEFEDDAEPPAA